MQPSAIVFDVDETLIDTWRRSGGPVHNRLKAEARSVTKLAKTKKESFKNKRTNILRFFGDFVLLGDLRELGG